MSSTGAVLAMPAARTDRAAGVKEPELVGPQPDDRQDAEQPEPEARARGAVDEQRRDREDTDIEGDVGQQQIAAVNALEQQMDGKKKLILAKIDKVNSAAMKQAMTIFEQTGQYPKVTIPTANTVGAQALQAAISRLGDPYVWGAAGPSQFDCSGLVMWAYAQVGIALPHYTGSQWNSGVHVARNDVRHRRHGAAEDAPKLALKQFEPYWMEEPTSPDDVLGQNVVVKEGAAIERSERRLSELPTHAAMAGVDGASWNSTLSFRSPHPSPLTPSGRH